MGNLVVPTLEIMVKHLERSQTTVSSKKRLIFVSEKKFTHSWEFFKKFTHSWEFFKKFTHSWEFFKKFTHSWEFFKKFTHSWEFFKDRNQNKLVSKRVEFVGYKSNNFERLLLLEQKYFC